MESREPRLTADAVESPLRRETHGGFGERSGETDREQSRHRAPDLLSGHVALRTSMALLRCDLHELLLDALLG